MVSCFCFGLRTSREMVQNEKLKEKSDKKSRCDKSSSSAKPARGLSDSETLQCPAKRTQIFTYQELKTATNDFSMESLIGSGGFGSVYKGRIESTGQIVAVKMLDKSGVQGDKEFLVEVLMLSLLHHENLVKLYGYCAEDDHRILVYEYMPLGSVEDHLQNLSGDQEPLDWNTRMQIAVGAAKGLEHLHIEANPPVIYRDLKTANILLDHGYIPKLSDFGLAKLAPTGDMTHVSTRVMGTRGYCAPEYANTGKLTIKSDIYSFGVVMLELITGRQALLDSGVGPNCLLVDWARSLYLKNEIKQIVDPMISMKDRYMKTTLKRALEVVFMCLSEEAKTRPSISEVLVALEYLAKSSSKQKEKMSIELGGVDMENTGTVSSLKGTMRMPTVKEEEEEKEIEDLERERSVAEAKSWAQNWRDLQRQSNKPPSPTPSKS